MGRGPSHCYRTGIRTSGVAGVGRSPTVRSAASGILGLPPAAKRAGSPAFRSQDPSRDSLATGMAPGRHGQSGDSTGSRERGRGELCERREGARCGPRRRRSAASRSVRGPYQAPRLSPAEPLDDYASITRPPTRSEPRHPSRTQWATAVSRSQARTPEKFASRYGFTALDFRDRLKEELFLFA